MFSANYEVVIEIDGGLGEYSGAIRFFGRGKEIMMWDFDEWNEDPSLVFAIVNAVQRAHIVTCDEFAAIIGKKWDDELRDWTVK